MVTHEAVLWPVERAVMGAHLRNHLFVTLNAPPGPDVVSIDPALFILIGVEGGSHEGAEDQVA